MENWDNMYAGYVIRDGFTFVGPSSDMWRVVLRSMAARFTKIGAMEFIKNNKGEFIIEDAS